MSVYRKSVFSTAMVSVATVTIALMVGPAAAQETDAAAPAPEVKSRGKVEEIIVRPERPAPQTRKLASTSGTWAAVPAVALKTQSTG